MAAVSVTVAGVLYTGGTLAFVPLLRALTSSVPGAAAGPWAAMAFVFLPLLTTWVGDTSAYFAGRAWGKAKLAPNVSPGKTVVGAVAGLIGSTAVAVALSATVLGELPVVGVGLLTAAWIGLLLGAAGQLGDLTESMLKREAGVKDSGKVLPGHGGMLDRIDSLLFSVPTAWGLLTLAGVIP
jgi:phosphatidate cytidylyltransferase